MSVSRSESGQASVELVGLLPLVAVIGFALWQAMVAGQAAWHFPHFVQASTWSRYLGGRSMMAP